ncbi:MAG TPA: response regulator [Chitinophagaceae bacterium]|nr:response regulator [Chitinophagaceae bacterium]
MQSLKQKIVVNTRPEIKLLLVDDREDNLFSIESILEKDGYIIRKANSGRAALKVLLKEQDFTLILMDVQMPDLNGFETATMIYEREKLRHIPIIFITAHDHSEENIFKGYQMGGVDYIYKPINPELMRAKVAVFVELYTKTHQLMAQEQRLKTVNQNLESEIQERISSEQKIHLLNQQLMENILQLKATNEELDRFAYVASHDLQEPLRKIMIFGDRLANKYNDMLGDDAKEYLHRMRKASERMQMLINNILDFSKFSAESQSFEETNLNRLLDDVISDLEIEIEKKKAVVEIEELPSLFIIPGQMRQLFQNLLSNSLKFSKKDNAPKVRVFAETVRGDLVSSEGGINPGEEFCRIHVQDNGIGFDEQYADKIFVIFQRLHSNHLFEGTGIGLSICKKIVEKHNGFISASSEPEKGATFTITLPYKQPVINGSATTVSAYSDYFEKDRN